MKSFLTIISALLLGLWLGACSESSDGDDHTSLKDIPANEPEASVETEIDEQSEPIPPPSVIRGSFIDAIVQGQHYDTEDTETQTGTSKLS